MAADRKARARLDAIEARMDNAEARLGQHFTEIAELRRRADEQAMRFPGIDAAVENIYARLNALESPAPLPDPTPTLLRHDPCTDPDPLPLWGALDAESPSRHQRIEQIPFGTYYRRLTVLDGDDYYGERCELGRNADTRTFAVYREGETKTTSFDLRLDPDYNLDSSLWADVMQMKQIAALSGGETSTGVAMELSPMNGHLIFRTFWTERARFPITPGEWTPIKIEAHYTIDPEWGYAEVSVGDATSSYDGPTLARAGTRPIPSHLRLGIYQHPSRKGTSVDVANIKVEEAG